MISQPMLQRVLRAGASSEPEPPPSMSLPIQFPFFAQRRPQRRACDLFLLQELRAGTAAQNDLPSTPGMFYGGNEMRRNVLGALGQKMTTASVS